MPTATAGRRECSLNYGHHLLSMFIQQWSQSWNYTSHKSRGEAVSPKRDLGLSFQCALSPVKVRWGMKISLGTKVNWCWQGHQIPQHAKLLEVLSDGMFHTQWSPNVALFLAIFSQWAFNWLYQPPQILWICEIFSWGLSAVCCVGIGVYNN